MQKLFSFLIVCLAFTALQVSTVGAQGGDPNMPPPTGAPGTAPMGDPNMPPPTGAPGTAPMGDPNMAPPTGAPGTAPMGDPNMAPPAGDISHCAEFSGPPKAACEAAATGK